MKTKNKVEINIKLDKWTADIYKKHAKDLGLSFNKWVEISLTASYISYKMAKIEKFTTKGIDFKNN